MNIYPLLRPLFFKLDPETAHHLTLKALHWVSLLGLSNIIFPTPETRPITVMGLEFSNPIGLAAGLDKNGDYIDALAAVGFGFIEIGTITPRPQPGNPKPRLFRLPEHQAIINRMGFNNKGVDHLVEQVKKARYQGVLGINIGKNFDTPIEKAADDYLYCLDKVYAYADYVTINISSPNTKNLRQLQQGDNIRQLLSSLKQRQSELKELHQKYVPLVLKIAPDLSDEEINHIAELLLEFKIDGVIATNTTIDRSAIKDHPLAEEVGGLSGAPVRQQANHVVKILAQKLGDNIPIIGVGGIFNSEHAQEKLTAGAQLIQVYSGLIYQGPQLVRDILQTLKG